MRHLLALLFALMGCGAWAQESDTVAVESESEEYYEEEGSSEEPTYTTVDPAELKSTRDYTKEDMPVASFDDKSVKKVIGSTDYNEEATPEKDTHEREKESGEDTDDAKQARDYTGLRKVLFFAMVLIIIGLIFYNILKNVKYADKLKPAGDTTNDTTHVEDIATLDLDAHLQQALASGNYRLVTRIYFLALLKGLNNAGLIDWKKDKTNRDYLAELFSKEHYYDDVRRLTLAYEQVWYGDHVFPLEEYYRLIDRFKAIDQRLTAERTP